MGLRTEIALLIHYGETHKAKTVIGKGDREEAVKVWGSIVELIIAKMREVVEGIDNEYADIREYKISHRVWEEARQAILKAMED